MASCSNWSASCQTVECHIPAPWTTVFQCFSSRASRGILAWWVELERVFVQSLSIRCCQCHIPAVACTGLQECAGMWHWHPASAQSLNMPGQRFTIQTLSYNACKLVRLEQECTCRVWRDISAPQSPKVLQPLVLQQSQCMGLSQPMPEYAQADPPIATASPYSSTIVTCATHVVCLALYMSLTWMDR
jgi:hypothetical protein